MATLAQVSVWPSWQALMKAAPFKRWVTLSTHHTQLYSEFQYEKNDALVFGSEGKGLVDAIRESDAQAGKLTLPMKENNRSLNLSNTVSIVVYEAWRQCGFAT